MCGRQTLQGKVHSLMIEFFLFKIAVQSSRLQPRGHAAREERRACHAHTNAPGQLQALWGLPERALPWQLQASARRPSSRAREVQGLMSTGCRLQGCQGGERALGTG